MKENNYTQEDEKILATNYAFTALVKTLKESGHLDMDHLISNLTGAAMQLENIGEDGAAKIMSSLNQNLLKL